MDKTAELDRLRTELDQARTHERQLGETRRAVLNLLEDLDDDRQRLSQAEEEWRTAFDSIRDAIFMHDEQWRITRVNHAYLALAGLPAEDVLGQPYFQIFPRLDGPLPGCSEFVFTEVDIELEDSVFRSRGYAVHGKTGEYLFSLHVLEDITERRRAETALRQRTEELARSNLALERAITHLKTAERGLVQAEKLAAIGTLASGVAHELNNPLMGVMNYVSYAEDKSSDPKGKEVLGKAARELQRMQGFVRNLLALGRPTGEVLVPVVVRDALERAADLLAADLRKRNAVIVTELPDDLPAVWGSLAPLQQVFINLLLNALDAMESAPEKQVRIEGRAEGNRVRVTVTDTGRGVPPEAESHLFEPFFSTKPEGRGTGLGLPTSQHIMINFGGDLEFVPQRGPGATFVLTFRIANLG